MKLSQSELEDVAYIIDGRANEIAMFMDDYVTTGSHRGSVERALTREIDRLRWLVKKILAEEWAE